MSRYSKSDYINREMAADCIVLECDDVTLVEARQAIKGCPSADVMPVRHGRWKEYGVNNDNTHNIACSICGHEIKSRGHANSVYTELKYRYCPYCGARMDGGDNE